MHNNALFPAIKSFLTNISKSSLKSSRIHIESKEQFSWWSDKKTTFTFLTCFCCLRVDNKYSFCPFFSSRRPSIQIHRSIVMKMLIYLLTIKNLVFIIKSMKMQIIQFNFQAGRLVHNFQLHFYSISSYSSYFHIESVICKQHRLII